MAMSALEARTQILDDLTAAIDQLALALACLSEAFEQLPVGTADRLEAEIFRPVQRAYGRGKRTHAQFAERVGLPTRDFGAPSPSPGPSSQGVPDLVKRAAAASIDADRLIAELQDSALPIESGDAQLRAGLSEVRELLGTVPKAAGKFLRTLGR